MKQVRRFFPLVLFILVAVKPAFPQAETVPVHHPVYAFLKRMEVKGIIERYHDAVLPLSRKEVAGFLQATLLKASHLPPAERGRLRELLAEFQFDIKGTVDGFSTTAGYGGDLADSVDTGFLENTQRFLYLHADTAANLFVNLLVDADGRHISGDALGDDHAEFLQLGFRARGTLLQHLGYSLTATNAQFWGSRDLLLRDPQLSQSHALTEGNFQNFDFEEGSVRYDGGIVSAQIGRERMLWGAGYDQKMILSDNPRVFDFIRADVAYKALRYTFLHAWLLGTASTLRFGLPADSSADRYEPVIADKFLAAHRLEVSFPGVLDVGAQEVVIYSNRSVDLGYLTPLSLFESVQRSRGDRDNVFWALDVQTHFLPNIEFSGTIMYDDIDVPDMFGTKWSDRYAWQLGMFYADPFDIPNTNVTVEYTRVEPYVYSHGRSRDDSYTSLNALLGANVGPNGDAMAVHFDYLPLRNLSFAFRVIFERHGANPVDSTGQVLVNVGGNVFFPHRDGVDSQTKEFLAGTKFRSRSMEISVLWEIINQCWLEAGYHFDSLEEAVTEKRSENHQLSLHLRLEL